MIAENAVDKGSLVTGEGTREDRGPRRGRRVPEQGGFVAVEPGDDRP